MEITQDTNISCCANCSFYDVRTGFCRLDPPQVVISYVNNMAFPTAAWPKINMPQLDWCSHFDEISENLN